MSFREGVTEGPPVHACLDAANESPLQSQRGDCNAGPIHKEAGHEGDQETKDAHICGCPSKEAEAVRAQYGLHMVLLIIIAKGS